MRSFSNKTNTKFFSSPNSNKTLADNAQNALPALGGVAIPMTTVHKGRFGRDQSRLYPSSVPKPMIEAST